MNEYPLVSIMIATFNSEKKIVPVLEAIRSQTYPQDKIEILCMDGGSIDSTREICQEYGCRVLDNPNTDPGSAKMIGHNAAAGKYLLTLDHDEVMYNERSIEIKVQALETNPECKVAFCSGYKRPADYPKLNEYVSEFGDPFSLFMYNYPKGVGFFEKKLKQQCKILSENNDYLVVSFENLHNQPIIELQCLGTMVNQEFFRSICKKNDLSDLTFAFYLMLERGNYNTIVTKEDGLLHYSADSLAAYWPKLKWRIINNVHQNDMSGLGYNGRENLIGGNKWKKYLFVPYVISTVVPFIHGLLLAISRKNSVYLMHVVFCWYVLVMIMYQYMLKFMNKAPKLTSYDGKKTIR